MVEIERGYGEGKHGDKWYIEWLGDHLLGVSHVCANQDQLVKTNAHNSDSWSCSECGALLVRSWAREIIKGLSKQRKTLLARGERAMEDVRVEVVKIGENDVVLHIFVIEDKHPERYLSAVILEQGDSIILDESIGIQLKKID